MSELRDRLLQAEVRVVSPRGLFELVATGAGDIAVVMSEGALAGWTDTALEREVAGAIDAALRAARRAYVQVRRDLFTPGRSSHRAGRQAAQADDDEIVDPGLSDGRAGSREPADVFRDKIDQIVVQGVSRWKYITIGREDDRRFRVRVRRHTLGRLTEPEVAQEIRSALAATLASYDQGYADAYRSAFGTDMAYLEGHA